MSTTKQSNLVKNMLENVRKGKTEPIGKVLTKSGYGKIAKQPSRVLKSKGVIALFKRHGITEETLGKEYKALLDLPVNQKSVNALQKLKILDSVAPYLIDVKSKALNPQLNLIAKFLNIEELGIQQGRPIEERKYKGDKAQVIAEIKDTTQAQT